MDNAPNEIEAKLERLLKNVPQMEWVEIKLPTGADVKIRPLTFNDEKNIKTAFTLSQDESEQVIKYTLNGCVDGIDIDSMAIVDKDYMLYKIREISYGSTYPLEGKCENCKASNTLKLQLSSLPVNYAPEDQNHTVTLPDSKIRATFRMPTVSEEIFIGSLEKRMDNLSRFVVDIDGETDQSVIHAFLRKTTVRDVDVLRKEVYNSELGFEKVIVYRCKACDKENRTVLAINEHFFSAS